MELKKNLKSLEIIKFFVENFRTQLEFENLYSVDRQIKVTKIYT